MSTNKLAKREAFFKEHHWQIVQEAIKHEHKTGYLKLFVNEDYCILNGDIEFIEGDFDEADFHQSKQEAQPDPDSVAKAFYIYYSVLWCDDQTKWNIKELVLLRQANPEELIKRLNMNIN